VAFAAGVSWWALAVGTEPNYVSGVLGGMLLTGVGVGLTLPTMMATASASLPPQAFATGTAVINTIRQTGLAIGVAILVAVLGTGSHSRAELDTFRHGWWVTAAIAILAVIPALGLIRQPAQTRPRPEGLR
jgi:MFS family permease